jgi:hypothetical protein
VDQQVVLDESARATALTQLRRAARSLRAFDVDTFTLDSSGPRIGRDPEPGSEGDRALVAAGALVAACVSFVDHLTEDIATILTTGVATAYEAAAKGHVLVALDRLPPAYDDHYSVAFARKLLVATISVTGRLAEPDWIPIACLAEQLALFLLVDQAAVDLEHFGLDEDPRARYQFFLDTAFENDAHLRLYDSPAPAVDYASRPASAPINAWFTPLYDGFYVHPYVEPRF